MDLQVNPPFPKDIRFHRITGGKEKYYKLFDCQFSGTNQIFDMGEFNKEKGKLEVMQVSQIQRYIRCNEKI